MSINDKIREVAKETEALVEENKKLQEENEKLEEDLRTQRRLKNEYKKLAGGAIAQVQELREQQDKLNSIHESSAKAQYEAELWQRRYEAAEKYIKDRLEITPASIPYDNVRMVLNAIKKHDLHELD